MNRPFSRPIFWPLVLVAIGTLWLLANFGVISGANLGILLRLWPVLLIGIGLDIIVRRRWPIVSNLIALVIVVLGVLAVVFAPRLGYAPAGGGWLFSMPWVWGGEPGSGRVITETREVSDFDAVSFGSLGELVVQQGETESLRIEGEDNVVREIRTEVRDGTLYIGSDDAVDWMRVQPTRPVRFMLTVRNLNELHLAGVGEVAVRALKTDELRVTLAGTGSLSFEELTAGSLVLYLSGAGSVTASGEVSRVEAQVSGLGSYNGADLQSDTASIGISGTGGATVWATEELDARISGLGSIRYYGSPDVSQAVSGLGGIQKLGDK